MNKIPTHRVTVEEMRQRVALKSDQNGFDGGLPDSRYPSATRTLINIIGFQPPEGDPTLVSPVGAQAAENAAIKINEGFNLGFCDALPGHGPMMHNHDTNETFMPISGRWRCLGGISTSAKAPSWGWWVAAVSAWRSTAR